MRILNVFFLLAGGVTLFAADLPQLHEMVQAVATDGQDVYAATRADQDDFTISLHHFDGSRWHNLNATISGSVHSLAADGGDLYVGGSFTLTAGTTTIDNLAHWDGQAWSPLGDGLVGRVYSLHLEGQALYVGGAFLNAGAFTRQPCSGPVTAQTDGIAIWDQGDWVALGLGIEGVVHAIAVDGTTVYAGGSFTAAGGTQMTTLARWDGRSWSSVGDGLTGTVYSLTIDGQALYAGGSLSVGDKASNVTQWNGNAWQIMSGFDGVANALSSHNGQLLAGGNFAAGDGQSFDFLATWDGSSWQQSQTHPGAPVTSLARANGGTYAASEDGSKGLLFIAD